VSQNGQHPEGVRISNSIWGCAWFHAPGKFPHEPGSYRNSWSVGMKERYGSGGTNGGFSPLYQVGGPRSIQLALKLQF